MKTEKVGESPELKKKFYDTGSDFLRNAYRMAVLDGACPALRLASEAGWKVQASGL